ncbi:MAG: cystathionine gamma-synthase [Micrococcales bacterium]|nr:MAG: cystathionine gamma-synthase [Micrococcales bacterium]PIE27393.1 MAG: cystathionine gamma-synthase [Micrococcales bacterium]
MADPVAAGWQPATRVVCAGRPYPEPGAPLNPPVTLTSTYIADGQVGYGRVGNPTWTALEDAVGQLEGGQGLSFASGMAAVHAVLRLVPAGGIVAVPPTCYHGTSQLLAELPVTVRRVDLAGATKAQLRNQLAATDLVWVESPANPTMELIDVPAVAQAAAEAGALCVCDNTFATPLLARPLNDGADVVVHSATKYLSGHSDVLLGVVVAAATPAGQQLHHRLHESRTLMGAVPGPMEAWLALRGLRTLDVRLTRAGESAAELARRLTGHPALERVRYPGFGAMLAVDVRGGAPAAEAMIAALQLWVHATSLGGVESQAERRRRHQEESDTVPPGLVRLSVGIEDVEDLWADLAAALNVVS